MKKRIEPVTGKEIEMKELMDVQRGDAPAADAAIATSVRICGGSRRRRERGARVTVAAGICGS